MKKPWMALTAALILSGCGGDADVAENESGIRMTNPHSEQLKALSPMGQQLAMLRALRDTRRRCQRVDAAAYQENYRNLEMWVALCNDGRSWGVFIAPNGDVQVRACDEHAQLDLPACRQLTPEPALLPDTSGNSANSTAG